MELWELNSAVERSSSEAVGWIAGTKNSQNIFLLPLEITLSP
jgi:hypothetical protein